MVADLGSVENEIEYLTLQIEQLNKQLNVTNTNYQQAANSLTDAKEDAKIAEETYQRQKSLFDASAISRLELDRAYDAWQATLRSVSGAQVGVKSSLNSDSVSTGSLQLELSRAEQSLEELKTFLANENLQGTSVISGMDQAIVASVNTQSGLFASSYQSLIELYDTSSLVVKAKVSEEFIQSVKIGQSVRIIPLMDREQILTGKVSFISAKATYENGETSVPIEIIFDDATTLMPNLNVDVEIPIQ
jgi:multidrug resistance efflux pump